MKSVLGELTDSTNRAEAFAMIPIVWAVAATAGPMMGGTLSRPHDHFPNIFYSKFWQEYPYFLPCIGAAAVIFISFLAVLLFFKETVPKTLKQTAPDASSDTSVPANTSSAVPLRELLIYPVILSISNYVTVAGLEIMFFALLPLFMTMPIEVGGLGCSPAVIGYATGGYGACAGIFQALLFARLVRQFGERRIFITGISAFLAIFALFPVISIVAQRNGTAWVVWSLLALMLFLVTVMDLAYTPKNALGATNGLAQTMVSISRAIGPALSTSLFSLSVEKNLLGGYAVYAILFMCSCLALLLAMRMPSKIWEEQN
ncbi:hypothetical protein AX17_002520 [Amanita inopinata Kibby_2008]|nr:hypothetical protein AX17_002520 [Amanita inopinata Kibby_2008]